MVPLVASRSPHPSAHRLKPPPDRSGLRKPGDWKVIRFHPRDPNLPGIMSALLPEVGADVGPSSGTSARRPASLI